MAALADYTVVKGKIWHTVDGKRTVATAGDKVRLPQTFGDRKVEEGKLKRVSAPGAENAPPPMEEELIMTLLAKSVAEIRTQLPSMDSPEMLRKIAEVEQRRGNRATLLGAIADRIEELEPEE